MGRNQAKVEVKEVYCKKKEGLGNVHVAALVVQESSMELFRKKQMLYNKFMTKKCQKC